MKLTPAQKLRTAMVQLNITQVELSKRTEQTQANLSYKICGDNFSIREYERLVQALGCKLELNIILPDGTKV